jgi:hypothetical protein
MKKKKMYWIFENLFSIVLFYVLIITFVVGLIFLESIFKIKLLQEYVLYPIGDWYYSRGPITRNLIKYTLGTIYFAGVLVLLLYLST